MKKKKKSILELADFSKKSGKLPSKNILEQANFPISKETSKAARKS